MSPFAAGAQRGKADEKKAPSRLVVDEAGVGAPDASLWPAAAQPICVVGDSQMRNLANALASAHGVAAPGAHVRAMGLV